jgi:hypothetical protein
MPRGVTDNSYGLRYSDVYGLEYEGLSSQIFDPVEASLMQQSPVEWLTIAA